MKKVSAIVGAISIIYLSSCAQHKVCPTYTKATEKQVKTELPVRN